jgi:hypothetical protein
MGPIAETLVRRAADGTRDPYVLYRQLAEYIDEATARERFLALAPALPSRIVEPRGEVTAEMLQMSRGLAIGHTELLELAPDSHGAGMVPAGAVS